MAPLVDRLLGEQLADGGWNCEVENGATVSSFGTTINVLEGLLEHERAIGGSAVVAAARRRGEEYLLERGLFRRKSTGEVIDPELAQFSFPTWYHYDVLRGLDYLRSAGVAPDERVAEALALVEQKRGEDGRWPLENTHAGEAWLTMDDGDGKPSRWNTLRAMRVLRWAATRRRPMTGTDHPGPGVLARRVGLGRGRGDPAGRRPRRHGADAAGPRVGRRRPLRVTFADHVDAIVAALRAAPAPAVLARPQRDRVLGLRGERRRPGADRGDGLRRHGAGQGRARPGRSRASRSRWCGTEIEAEENLDGLTEAQLATFRERAVPVPGGLIREGHEFTNDARMDIPATIIATGFSAADYQKYAQEHPSGHSWPAFRELRNVTWIDLPTSHWPMWSKPGRHRPDHRRRRRPAPGRPVTAIAARRRVRPPHLGDRAAHRRVRGPHARAARTPAPGTYGSIIDTFRHLVSSDGWYLSFFREAPARSTRTAE